MTTTQEVFSVRLFVNEGNSAITSQQPKGKVSRQ